MNLFGYKLLTFGVSPFYVGVTGAQPDGMAERWNRIKTYGTRYPFPTRLPA